jgi:hypothetical protein
MFIFFFLHYLIFAINPVIPFNFYSLAKQNLKKCMDLSLLPNPYTLKILFGALPKRGFAMQNRALLNCKSML